MKPEIFICYYSREGEDYCRLTSYCLGWGCKHLKTEFPPVDEFLQPIPENEIDKCKIFVSVFREARSKGVDECPAYRYVFINQILDNK